MPESLSPDQIFIRKLTDIILANLSNENFGVKELAGEAGISRYSLAQRLNAINRKTAIQFIREVRLEKAREMLQNETLTAAEIAYRTGFGSPAYFNKCFHEYFGYPPGKVVKGSDIQTSAFTEIPQKKSRLRKHVLSFGGIMLLIIMSGATGYFLIKKINKRSFSASDLPNICARSYGGGSFQI